ncbi:hypothetical protein D9M72_536360 [compost metagenome]
MLKSGSMPMRNVAEPISTSVSTRVFLRPILSPRWPKTTAPKGRATYATPKVAKEAIRATVGSPAGKKILEKTSDAAVA